MGPGFESLKVHHKKTRSAKHSLFFYRYILSIQNPEKFRLSEISSQVSAIAAYRFIAFCSANGGSESLRRFAQRKVCFANVYLVFRDFGFNSLRQSSKKFRNAKFTLKLAQSLHIELSLFVALTGVLEPVIRGTPNKSAVCKTQNQKFF